MQMKSAMLTATMLHKQEQNEIGKSLQKDTNTILYVIYLFYS